jgi:predicted enzyme related to lactoylglutathione lyase
MPFEARFPSHRSTRDVIVRTEDFAAAVNFYQTVLGLTATPHSESLVGFETGSFCLYVQAGKPHGPIFEFLVADVESAKQRLLNAGCSVIEEDPAVPRCYICDPYGMTFNIGRI